MITCNSHLKDKVPAELNWQMMSKLKYHQKIKQLVGVIPLVLLLLLLLTIFIQDTHVTEVIFSGVLHIYLT